MYATYSFEDDKLRLYPAFRLDTETYARVKRLGFRYAPTQELFFAVWTTAREDLLIELCGAIETDGTTLAERAAAKQARMAGYADHAAQRAQDHAARSNAIAERFWGGQPILLDHYSAKRALADQERMWSAMGRAVAESDRAEYWRERAHYALAHAARHDAAPVIYRRIEKLEKDARQYERALGQVTDPEAPAARRYLRGLEHNHLRLVYERELYAAVGGIVADKLPIEKGGAVKFLDTWYEVVRVNPKSVTITGWLGVRGFEYRLPIEEVAQAVSREQWQTVQAKLAGDHETL